MEDSILPVQKLIYQPKGNSNPGRPSKRRPSRKQIVSSLIKSDDDDQ